MQPVVGPSAPSDPGKTHDDRERAAKARAALVFPLPGFTSLLAGLRGIDHGRWALRRFSDGELHARLDTPAHGRACAILGTLAPPDRRTLAVALLAHTLRRSGARTVTAVLPYLGYARQDHAEPGRSLGLEWATTLLDACGVDEIVTLDIHNPASTHALPVGVRSLSPAGLLAGAVRGEELAAATVVAPDDGAVQRAGAVAWAAGIRAPVVVLHKRRDEHGVAHTSISGHVTGHALIVDDILDTGGTLVSGCRRLRAEGAERITVLVTHALLTGERWRELSTLGVERIVTTDSLPNARRRGAGFVETVPCGPLVLAALAEHDGAP